MAFYKQERRSESPILFTKLSGDSGYIPGIVLDDVGWGNKINEPWSPFTRVLINGDVCCPSTAQAEITESELT